MSDSYPIKDTFLQITSTLQAALIPIMSSACS